MGDPIDETSFPDIGANHHMTSNPTEAKGIHSYSSKESVMVGNDADSSITSVGQFNVLGTQIKLNNILIVLEIACNLFSVSQFTKDNHCCFLF